uniref:Hexose transporter 1 n=1 Tax=Mucochytrium quahogii TaxID=96639 RepID=A0A7S2WKY3_9STRA|mmetsp:Transcript_6579/g.11621  ORF Transcript_6579/g.11621 Transcript_6579/m.11621 type:complete len:551 (-) Transcript_6579:2369-4021(-)
MKSPVQASSLEPASESLVRGLNAHTVLVLLCAILGGLLFGLDIGTGSTVANDHFRKAMGIPLLPESGKDSSEAVGKTHQFTILFHVASLIGAPIAGQVADRFGRKSVIIAASLLFAAGGIWQACAGIISSSFGWNSIVLGRIVGGLGNGFLLVIMPVYAAELSPAHIRGKTITLFQLFITIGIFLMSVYNKAVENVEWGWRLGFALQSVPCAVVLVLALVVLPESPRYLVTRDRVEEARAALVKLSSGNAKRDAIAEKELQEIVEEVAEIKAAGEGTFAELFRGNAFPALCCAVMIAFSQNITGVNWFMSYGPSLYNSLGFQPFLFDMINKGINVVATIASLFVIDRFGRKFLTVWGTSFVILFFGVLCIMILATGAQMNAPGDLATSTDKAAQTFSVVMINVFQVVFAITWGPLGWLVPSEVFSIRNRGKGMSCAVIANMITNIVFGDYGYSALYDATSFEGTIGILVLFNVVIVFTTVVFLQPGTKGVSLEDMRKVFAYEYDGNDELSHGTLRAFYRKNLGQTMKIYTCRAVDPTDDFEQKPAVLTIL